MTDIENCKFSAIGKIYKNNLVSAFIGKEQIN